MQPSILIVYGFDRKFGISPAYLPTHDNPAGSNPESLGGIGPSQWNQNKWHWAILARDVQYALVRRLDERWMQLAADAFKFKLSLEADNQRISILAFH